MICHMVNLSLEHGNSDASCFAYVWFGIIAGTALRELRRCVSIWTARLRLVGKARFEDVMRLALVCASALLMPWAKHARHSRDLLRHAFDVAYRMGDFTYAAYSFSQLVTNYLVVGDPLAEAQAEAEKGVEFAKRATLRTRCGYRQRRICS